MKGFAKSPTRSLAGFVLPFLILWMTKSFPAKSSCVDHATKVQLATVQRIQTHGAQVVRITLRSSSKSVESVNYEHLELNKTL